jgi:hypothetical protein
MSELMWEVCRLLQISRLCTSPYHAMCNGLCEKFNGVLKKIRGPLICLPFELLYGRHIRGPLAVLKEEWEEPSTCQNQSPLHIAW